MAGRIFLAEWDEATAREKAHALRGMGWATDFECRDELKAFERIRKVNYDAVVVGLDKAPSVGYRLAMALRRSKGTRGIPVVFVDGKGDWKRRVKDAFPRRGKLKVRQESARTARTETLSALLDFLPVEAHPQARVFRARKHGLAHRKGRLGLSKAGMGRHG
jgi:hypothetical protein